MCCVGVTDLNRNGHGCLCTALHSLFQPFPLLIVHGELTPPGAWGSANGKLSSLHVFRRGALANVIITIIPTEAPELNCLGVSQINKAPADLSRIVWNFPLAPENFLALNRHRIRLVMKFTVGPVPEIVAVSQ